MKQKIAIFLALTILILSGCQNAEPAEVSKPTTHHTDSVNESPDPVFSVSQTEDGSTIETDPIRLTRENSPENQQNQNESGRDNNQDSTPTWTDPVIPTSPLETKPQNPNPVEPKPQQTQPKEAAPTEATPTQAVTEPSKPEPTRPETVPTVPEMKPKEPTIPDSSPTEPPTTEPTGCAHDWVRIHHDEEGHWKAGVVCDCGWTLYGKSDEVASKWNAHSASYSPEESFLNHGGYGSVDEWIVDKPAYDEWVCCHCGEPKQ